MSGPGDQREDEGADDQQDVVAHDAPVDDQADQQEDEAVDEERAVLPELHQHAAQLRRGLSRGGRSCP